MNIESVREYCLTLPLATEDMAFGDDYLLLRVCNRIFACIGLADNTYFVVKCDPDRAVELRERYPDDVLPAWHWNKKYWNQLRLDGRLSDEVIRELIRHSYSEVAHKLPLKLRRELPALPDE